MGNIGDVERATNDLVSALSKEIDHLFEPRILQTTNEKGEPVQIQTNPYTGLGEAQKTEIVLNTGLLLVAQILGEVLAGDPKADTNLLFASISKRLRTMADGYHKRFVELKSGEKNGTQGS